MFAFSRMSLSSLRCLLFILDHLSDTLCQKVNQYVEAKKLGALLRPNFGHFLHMG